jgi:hypothetical protein
MSLRRPKPPIKRGSAPEEEDEEEEEEEEEEENPKLCRLIRFLPGTEKSF